MAIESTADNSHLIRDAVPDKVVARALRYQVVDVYRGAVLSYAVRPVLCLSYIYVCICI
jgi:hypothetical protein